MKLSRRGLFAIGLAGIMASVSLPAIAANVVVYTQSVMQSAVASGKPFLLDFSATWCSTCKAQERVLNELQAENSAYNDIQILRVDWDTHRSGSLVSSLSIPRRSTLVMVKGDRELGRVVAQTGKPAIAALLDLGL